MEVVVAPNEYFWWFSTSYRNSWTTYSHTKSKQAKVKQLLKNQLNNL